MTVTRATTLLYSFRSKIEEAVSIVPRMCAEEKLKAVQFWNIVSEKLQDIVNNSAADINAIALKMGEDDSEKITIEINATADSSIVSHHSISSEFMSLSGGYTICNEAESQFHNSEINSTHLKHLLSSESTFTSSSEQSLSSVANMPHIDHLSSAIEACEKLNNQREYLTVQNLPTTACDNFSTDPSCPSEISRELPRISSVKSNSHLNKDISSNLEGKLQHCESTQGLEQNSNNENCDINKGFSDSCISKNSKSSKRSNKCLLMKNSVLSNDSEANILKGKFDYEKQVNMHASGENSSGDKLEFDSIANLDESSESNSAEHIVSFVVSNSEEILSKNEIRHEKSREEKLNTNLTFICKECDKEFSDIVTLSSHCWAHNHKPFSCTDCQAQFSTKGNLIVHMRKHTGEKPYPCGRCSSRFSTKGNLKRHIKTHTGEKPFQCSRCGNRFTEKKSLTVHMRRHTGERPYQCKVCGKRFAQTGILQTHMAMHLDQRVHLCEHCGKSFRQKSQLRIHKLRHDNVRKYQCPCCPARFLTKGDLERHRRMHTGERPFSCDICSKSFTRQQSLNEHMNRHYGLRPYICKYCSKGFAEMSACYKHIKLHERTKDADEFKSNENETSVQPLDNSVVDKGQPVSSESESKLPVDCDDTASKNNYLDPLKDSSKDSTKEKTLSTPFIHIFMQ